MDAQGGVLSDETTASADISLYSADMSAWHRILYDDVVKQNWSGRILRHSWLFVSEPKSDLPQIDVLAVD